MAVWCAPASAADLTAGNRVTICPAAAAGCDFTSLARGLAAVQNGGTVVIAPGIYREAGVLRASNVVVKGGPGVHIKGVAAQGKAALVVGGNDTLIEGVECSNIEVAGRNGSCVRLEGRNLTLRRVYFHDSEEGVLTGSQGGTVIVEDSRFERLGAIGRAHGIYAGQIDQLVIRRSQFLSSRDEGHEVKSRASRTVIEDSLIASLDGVDSRLVDVPNGGELVIRRSLLEKGGNSVNADVIGFGLEGIKYQDNSVTLENCTVIVDGEHAQLVSGAENVILRNIRMIGGRQEDASGTEWFPDRQSAGLPPYPALPADSFGSPTRADAASPGK